MTNPKFITAIAPLALGSFLMPALLAAQSTSFTATGWVNAVPAPGTLVTNNEGQVIYRGGIHKARVQGSDPRFAGQVIIITEGGYHANGTATLQGPAYFEVGAWDTAGTNFTRSGPMWDLQWKGLMQTDYSLQLDLAGYGIGGAIDGQRIAMKLSRAPAGGPIDPAIPYLYEGTILAPPVNTNLFSDDFSDGLAWTILKGGGTVTMNAVGGQLLTHEDWTGVAQGNSYLYAFAPTGAWSIGDGQTLECQADLISISQNATNVAFVWVGTGSAWYQFNYEIGSGPHSVSLDKGGSSGHTFFWATNAVQLPAEDVTLYLALTRAGANLIITTRVLDKDNQNAVVFERSFVDTPGVDASLSAAQIAAFPELAIVPGAGAPDPGPPLLSGAQKGVGVFQRNNGGQPPVDAVWDNFSLRLSDLPPLSIARAVQVSWPAVTGANYILQQAPAVQGPWLPLQELAMPGLNQKTLPISNPATFIRLVPAP